MCKKCSETTEYKNGLCKKCYKAKKVKEFYLKHPGKSEEYAKKKELKKLITEMDEFGMPETLQETFLFGGSKLDQTLQQLDHEQKNKARAKK